MIYWELINKDASLREMCFYQNWPRSCYELFFGLFSQRHVRPVSASLLKYPFQRG